MQPDTDDDRRGNENDPQEACLNPASSITDDIHSSPLIQYTV
jgi:hypothetical protein